MINPFHIGDKKTFIHTITDADVASFSDQVVHPVYSTFALARDAEWSGRLFVLEMKEEEEEGIGTGIEIRHLAPALIGEEARFISILAGVEKNTIITTFEAFVGPRKIAAGRQWQKIVGRKKLDEIFSVLKAGKSEHG